MALSLQNKADIRTRLGWSGRWHQSDSRLEQAMSALETQSEHEKWITNSLTPDVNEPIGLLASCEDIDTKLVDAHGRLKAMKVGSIELPGGNEIRELRKEGARFVATIASILGVEVRHNYYSSQLPRGFQGPFGLSSGGNYGLQG